MFKMLIINPGSTSTKIAVYEDEKEILVEVLRHSAEEIAKYNSVIDQKDFRKDVIFKVLEEKNIDVRSLNAIVGRGGLLKPVMSGTYEVNEAMLEDLSNCINGEHASNLGGIIAKEFAKELNLKAFIVDPVVVDELTKVARISGIPELPRKSIFHALNQKAVAKSYAKENSKKYEDLNLIVVHLGGGVSVGAHKNGKVVDVNNALDGEGTFSPERSGTVPAGDLVRMCFDGKYSKEDILKKITGKGGIVAYLNSNDAREVEAMIDAGDEKASLIYDAMKYQICKDIGAFSVVLKGKVDAIIVTGGIAYSKSMIEYIKESVGWISDIIVYPGEDEMLALAQGVLRVLNKEEEPMIY